MVVDSSTTLLSAVVAAAREEAQERSQAARRIWLPPLPPVVELSAVVARAGQDVQPGQAVKAQAVAQNPPLRAPVGLIDRPYHQRQDPLVVDFTTGGGHLALCGGPQSGKSMALR
ncbi:hypothetical protein M4D70_26405, partial [Brevibacillus borstelensis]|nr:hypothetical protein [Brevibacillus borstelensis]